MTAFTVTACGGGSAAALAQGSAFSQWTQAEVSKFTAAAGSGGSGSQDSCAVGYFERDMSFGNAMAVVSVDSASGPSLSAAQVKATLVSKYGTAFRRKKSRPLPGLMRPAGPSGGPLGPHLARSCGPSAP